MNEEGWLEGDALEVAVRLGLKFKVGDEVKVRVGDYYDRAEKKELHPEVKSGEIRRGVITRADNLNDGFNYRVQPEGKLPPLWGLSPYIIAWRPGRENG